jgi:hypothetical protein
LYRRITPFDPPETEVTPDAKVKGVPTPKSRGVPVLSTTVGLLLSGEIPAPPKVRVFVPVYPLATFPNESRAVMVRALATPAATEVEPVMTNFAAGPGLTVTFPEVPVLLPMADVALN